MLPNKEALYTRKLSKGEYEKMYPFFFICLFKSFSTKSQAVIAGYKYLSFRVISNASINEYATKEVATTVGVLAGRNFNLDCQSKL